MGGRRGIAALQRRLEQLPDQAEAESSRPSGHPLLDLQQQAGNRATTTLVQTRLSVGRVDDPAERNADDIAAVAMRSLAGGRHEAVADVEGEGVQRHAAGVVDELGGTEVDAEVSRSIDAARGGGRSAPAQVRGAVEGVAGADLSGVRVHTDDRADQLSRSLQAEAFTTGSDIFFRKGAYDPGSTSGQELVAHELAHVAQQGGTARRREIRRRIDPLTAITFDQWASKSGGGKDAKGFLFFSPTYKKIKSGLEDYVAQQDSKDARWKAAKLKSIDANLAAWLGDKKHRADRSDDANRRREAIVWLTQRIQAEAMMVARIGEKQQKGGGVNDAGGMNSVELGVKTSSSIGFSKSNTGVFKAGAASYSPIHAPAAEESGIDPTDPRLVERAVASSAVAKLMGSDVIADTVAATRKGQAGYLMEQATGSAPAAKRTEFLPASDEERLAWTALADEGRPGYEYVVPDDQSIKPYVVKVVDVVADIDWKDPELHEQLVELQLFDAITGQVDRHHGNYFIDQSGPRTKVKGIDTDLSFGKNKGTEQMPGGFSGANDKSAAELPPICSRSTFERIMGVTERELHSLLGATLSSEEVAAAVARLRDVKAHLRMLDSAGLVLESFRDEDDDVRTGRFTHANSYIGRDQYSWARAKAATET